MEMVWECFSMVLELESEVACFNLVAKYVTLWYESEFFFGHGIGMGLGMLHYLCYLGSHRDVFPQKKVSREWCQVDQHCVLGMLR
jgi:hypothetical protein